MYGYVYYDEGETLLLCNFMEGLRVCMIFCVLLLVGGLVGVSANWDGEEVEVGCYVWRVCERNGIAWEGYVVSEG